MKKCLIVMMALLMAVTVFATTISDIRTGAVTAGTIVTVSGIVTGEPYAFGGNKMYIQDGTGPNTGIYLYMGANIEALVPEGTIVAEGDSVTVTGTVADYYGLAEITSVTALTLDQAGVGCPEPMVLSAADAKLEGYEGCLVRLENVAVADPKDSYGEWSIAQGVDTLVVDDEGNAPYYFWPEDYDSLISITGLMSYSYNTRKIVPRLAWDIVEGPLSGDTKIYTRIQRIQQVRGSDLLKTPDDLVSDMSYVSNPDTIINIKGVVTMPTGLSYAGTLGKKFILSDIHGGPWSSILSYTADGTQYPDLVAGDLIDMSGYVGEYTIDDANMTEFWLVGNINLLEFDYALPDTAVIKTGDLRLPITAEQWGNVIVHIDDAIITAHTSDNSIFEMDDGTGACLVDDDSDSLSAYADNPYVVPPVMTPISVTGWIYHHGGSYADSSTYKIAPLYHEDLVVGEGPAMILNESRTPANIPTSSQSVIISALISTVRNIDTAKVYYSIDGGNFTSVDMVDAGSNIWSATIPAQSSGSIVEYYYYVVDDSSDVSLLPSNPEEELFAYKVLDTAPTIYDIQYTHAETGLSPLHGCTVTFDATITSEGILASNFTDNSNYGVISVASDTGAWNGVWVLANLSSLSNLHEGDIVTVSGKVDDDHEGYYKWTSNTYIVGTVTVKLAGEPRMAPTGVTLSKLEAAPEAYEGVLVELADETVIESINSYDLTLSDGLGTFLLDDDIVADSTFDINYQENAILGETDTLIVGDTLTNVQGVVMFSYATVKIEVRKTDDITIKIKPVNPGIADVPENFVLHQNYPNPFNPVTTIRFDLATATDVKLTIYDLMGRKVQELVNATMNAGSYDLRWDAGKLSSGMYLYRLETPEFTATNKLLLLK